MSWEALDEEVVNCFRCPRLVEWRERIAREKRAAYRHETYWGRPVPGFGDRGARLLILGLAPAAHGANRTGRFFTGDRSGDFLFGGLHRSGYSNRPFTHRADDDTRLTDVYITAAVRCAPPENKPLPAERAACAPYLDRELELLAPTLRAVLCLGAIGWDAAWRALDPTRRPRPRFAHGAEERAGELAVIGCFHPSQQNTFTGKLTLAMLDGVLRRCREISAG